MSEFYNAHIVTRFESLSPKQRWLWVGKTYHPESRINDDISTDPVNTVREENFGAAKDAESWSAFIQDPVHKVRVTFSGSGPREKRTFPIPDTRDAYLALRQKYYNDYVVANDAVRPIDLFPALKDDDAWDRHFSNPSERTKVTFPGNGYTANRTYNIPKTREECYKLFFAYREYELGYGPRPKQEDYPPQIQESNWEEADEDSGSVDDGLSYELTPTLTTLRKVEDISALQAFVEPIYREMFPENLLRVPTQEGGTETVNFVAEVNKRALQLFTEQRGDIDTPKSLAQFALAVFDFPLQAITSEKHIVNGKDLGTRLVLQRDQYPEGYEARARELVLQAYASYLRNARKVKTMADAQKIINSLPQKNFYNETRTQLTSILANERPDLHTSKKSSKKVRGGKGRKGGSGDLTN